VSDAKVRVERYLLWRMQPRARSSLSPARAGIWAPTGNHRKHTWASRYPKRHPCSSNRIDTTLPGMQTLGHSRRLLTLANPQRLTLTSRVQLLPERRRSDCADDRDPHGDGPSIASDCRDDREPEQLQGTNDVVYFERFLGRSLPLDTSAFDAGGLVPGTYFSGDTVCREGIQVHARMCARTQDRCDGDA